MKLKEKAALVTGSARGLGLATAQLFVEEGASVVCIDAAPGDSASFAREHFAGSDRVTYQKVDITKPEELAALASSVQKAFGRLDVLVNNAAVDTIGSVEETTEEEFRRILDVNVYGTYCVTRAFMSLLKKAGKGAAIVNALEHRAHGNEQARCLHNLQGRRRELHPQPRHRLRFPGYPRQCHCPGRHQH